MQGIQLANGRAGTHLGSETVPAVCGWVHARMHEPQVWEAWETPTHTPPFLGFSAKEGHVPRMFAGAFFLLNAGPGSFNPQPDGESCWQRRGPHIIVPFTKAHLSGSSGVGWELGWEHRPAFIPPRRAEESRTCLPAGGGGHCKQGLLQGGNHRSCLRKAGDGEGRGAMV